MRRERSQSSDRGRPYVPRWDNPTGQLPGTGIPSGSDSGFHGTSRSVPERSRLRTSESGASAGESRPSLFDGLSSGFHLLEQLGTWELRRELLELPQEVFHLETMLRL